MAVAVAYAAARSVFRSVPVRSVSSRLASAAKPTRLSFSPTSTSRITRPRPGCVLRYPVQMSACLETIQPYHTATASALMTSLLTVARCGYGWLPDGSYRIFQSQNSPVYTRVPFSMARPVVFAE